MGPVNFSSIHELAEMGTDIIFIEKEGIVEVLSPFAKPCAIALVNTHGRTTKYVRKLVKIAKRSGARVCVLHLRTLPNIETIYSISIERELSKLK
jgi:hypothetical protein